MKILMAHNYYQYPGREDKVLADESGLLESQGPRVVRYTLSNDAIERMNRWSLLRSPSRIENGSALFRCTSAPCSTSMRA